MQFVLVVGKRARRRTFIATLSGVGDSAEAAFAAASPAVVVLLAGDRPYAALLPDSTESRALVGYVGARALVEFPGRSPLKYRLARVRVPDAPGAALPTSTNPIRLTPDGAPPLYLFADGALSARVESVDEGLAAGPALVTAARWISGRRTTTFERLFPPSAFHPDIPVREERLSVEQAEGLLAFLNRSLDATAPSASAPEGSAELRSAALTVLSHLVATALRDPGFSQISERAADRILQLIDAETGAGAVPALRAHGINLLQLRGPALSEAHREAARSLLRASLRLRPPYEQLPEVWRFAVCSDREFHEGECDILLKNHFRELPEEQREVRSYRVFEAPFRSPTGGPIRFYARDASPHDENEEMGDPEFVGLLINRHAQLGVYDMRAAATRVRQRGYKLMMNSQCAGLTTRYQMSRLFPDADIYSSWDSTYFRTGADRRVTHSEGMDCFLAVVTGMAAGEDHARLSARSAAAQWHHEAANAPGFVQFVGPAHPAVTARFADVNNDGKSDIYDGYLDLRLAEIAEDLLAASTPRDPGVAASQIGGEAAVGLVWAAGSLNRVTQYSDLWDGLPASAERLYPFTSAGFFDAGSAPVDVPGLLPGEDPGALPAVCRYLTEPTTRPNAGSRGGGLSCEVLFSGRLAHAPKELKRLLVLAEATQRAFDAGVLPARGVLSSPAARRAMVLLGLAGLLEFPADQNRIDLLWSRALVMLKLPAISRSTVRGCISHADHDASNYYGSLRGVQQLIGRDDQDRGVLEAVDAVARRELDSPDPWVGRAAAL